RGGYNAEAELLSSCYRKSIQIALERKFESLAFPCVSTGIYGYPKDKAAEIAVKTCSEELKNNSSEIKSLNIIFCCFGQDDFEIYQQIINK
ncbi:MAG: macro domain-containing protein, partial [Cyanobacteria bacterium J06621_15]